MIIPMVIIWALFTGHPIVVMALVVVWMIGEVDYGKRS